MLKRLLQCGLFIFFGLSLMLTLRGAGTRPEGWPLLAPAGRADIVVYGGSLAGCAAAWKAAAAAPDKQVALVVPYPEREYGGLATVGGQNFWDLRYWDRDGKLAQGGSFARWLAAAGPFYRPADLAAQISADLDSLSNLETYWAMDITAVQKDRKGRLGALALRDLQRDAAGSIIWGAGRMILAASVFVDASEDGRLSRLSEAGVTVGRADWPAEFLTVDYIKPGQGGSAWPGRTPAGHPGFYPHSSARVTSYGELPAERQAAAALMLPGGVAGAAAGLPVTEPAVTAATVAAPAGSGREGSTLLLHRQAGALPASGMAGAGTLPAARVKLAGEGGVLPRQQAATLMFKVKGVKPGVYPDMIFRQERGTWGAYGGSEVYINDPVVTGFNDQYGPLGFALKPLNVAQDGPDSPEWWVNALLVFNVDGRANARDRWHDTFPGDLVPGALDTDTAWQRARQMLANPDFLRALRRFAGFEEAEVVRDGQGRPVTGGMLYLRETIHSVMDPREAGPGTEDRNYALTAMAVHGAGPGPDTGSDAGNYVNRIGLGFYWQDINAYHFADMQGAGGRYRWPVTPHLRPDYPLTGPGPRAWPQNPVYLPFNTLLSRPVSNLLIPGYAASISSLAWAALRVLPNQCVLGDAAGVAAAYALQQGRDPGSFTGADVAAVREILVQRFGARVDK